MILTCMKCETEFDADLHRGYCDDCVAAFREARKTVREKQNPAEGVHVTGKFVDPSECPHSTVDPVRGKQVCGLCGSEELDMGYGFAGGYGLGGYNFCWGCNTVLDFCEDRG